MQQFLKGQCELVIVHDHMKLLLQQAGATSSLQEKNASSGSLKITKPGYTQQLTAGLSTVLLGMMKTQLDVKR